MEFLRQSLLVINVKEPIIVPLCYKNTDLAKLKRKNITWHTLISESQPPSGLPLIKTT